MQEENSMSLKYTTADLPVVLFDQVVRCIPLDTSKPMKLYCQLKGFALLWHLVTVVSPVCDKIINLDSQCFA
jgi:hypothetical protein